MRTYLRRLGPFVLAGLLMAGWAVAQNSPGGSFLPGFNYIVSGQWTWRNIASPWIIEGTTEDANETTITFTEPTADRTVTFGNQTGTVVLGQTALKVVGGTIALDGSNPSSATTGLATIVGCSVSLLDANTIGIDPISFSLVRTATAGQLDVYAWKATSSSNPTLTASTNSSSTVAYLCTGT